MNTSYLFQKMLGTALAILLLLGMVSVPVFAEPTRQNDEKLPVHLIIGVGGDGDWSAVELNRSTWDDFNSTNSVHPGMALQERDYVSLSGDNSLQILCADLSKTELFEGVSECEATDTPAFINMDTPLWTYEGVTVNGASIDTPVPSDLVDSEVIPVTADESVDAQRVVTSEAIAELGLDPDVEAYVNAYALASQGFYLNAVNELLAVEDLECTEQRNFVDIEDGESIYENPSVYLRMGEWYAILGNPEVSARYLQCAVDLAEENGDLLSAGLAYSRLAVVTEDAEQRSASYQAAINNFNALRADSAVSDLLDACGSANCTVPPQE